MRWVAGLQAALDKIFVDASVYDGGELPGSAGVLGMTQPDWKRFAALLDFDHDGSVRIEECVSSTVSIMPALSIQTGLYLGIIFLNAKCHTHGLWCYPRSTAFKYSVCRGVCVVCR